MTEFLLALSLGLHRYAMYPPGHPSLEPVVADILARLGPALGDGDDLPLGVARRHLLAGGGVTDPDHPVLGDLARRLHEQNLGAVVIRRGAEAGELAEMLTTLTEDAGPRREPLGLRPPDEIPTWRHLRLVPVGFEHLVLSGRPGPGGEGSAELWLGLARDALAREALTRSESADGEGAVDVEEIARAIAAGVDDEEYAARIAGYVRRLARTLQAERGAQASEVTRRLARLVRALDDDALRRLLARAGGGGAGRLAVDASRSLPGGAVVRILEAASHASGHHISRSLTRLLSKLAAHADAGTEGVADAAGDVLRENVERLVEDWELENPNPEAYDTLLDSLAASTPLVQSRPSDRRDPGGPERILDTALEVESWGPTVGRAVDDLVGRGQGPHLLDRVLESPEESETAHRVVHRLMSPLLLRSLLANEDVTEETLVRLVGRAGSAAVDPLLDVLADSDSRLIRRRIFALVPDLGPDLGRRAVERLDDGRAYVLRNMLALLRHLPERPGSLEPLTYLRHDDRRVRREAFHLSIRDPRLRSRALGTALADPDERLVRMALLELSEAIPATLEPVVVHRVLEGDRGAEVRALAARALEGARSTLARDALVEMVVRRRTILGRRKLADPGPDTVAAVEALNRGWGDDPEVQPVLRDVRESKEEALRRAAARPAAGDAR